jgi:hypothetical protein
MVKEDRKKIFKNNIRLKKKCAKLIYLWCKENLPVSRYHDNFPKMVLSNQNDKFFRGYYKDEKNLIGVYLKNNRSKKELCETIIHEWKHYQQNIYEMYDRYIVYYGYETNNHPYEISAEKYAKKHAEKCLNWLKQNIK